MPPKIHSIDHLVLTVASIPASVAFYSDVLGMKAEVFEAADGSKRWALYFGQQKINLHQHKAEFDPKSSLPTPGSADICLLSNDSLEEWQAHFEKMEVSILQGPVARSGALGPIMSIYVRDPDGNLIEVSVSKD